MRNIKASQNLVHNLLENGEDFVPLTFVNSATRSMGVERVAQDIKDTLRFDLNTFRRQKTYGDAFKYLRQRVENSGIFVLLASDLGSHHSTISLEVFRGFAFADPIAPFIVINRQDAVSAWSFTTLHEVTHLWLGESGVSGTWGEEEIERFCDNVAASILLPAAELNDLPSMLHTEVDEAAAAISSFAAGKNVSRTMVTFNLLKQDKIRQSIWHPLSVRFKAEWEKQKDNERASRRQKKSGPSYYAVRRFHLGPALVGLAKYFVSTGELTPSKAGVILGVNPAKVNRLLNPEPSRR
jgi:Zn-dependent peptidase ImmA (M78 family)